jgi:hypothetical protein
VFPVILKHRGAEKTEEIVMPKRAILAIEWSFERSLITLNPTDPVISIILCAFTFSLW